MAIMEESDLNRTNAVKSRSLQDDLGVLAFALMVNVVAVCSASAGPPAVPNLKLTHVETVQQTTVTGEAFGPVGPGCASTGGPNCTFLTVQDSANGQATPFGPFTSTGILTISFADAAGSFVTPSGAVDPTTGNRTGICAPEFGTDKQTFSDGSTLSLNFQGTVCCGAADCSSVGFLGPPFVNHIASIITSGTGRFAGARGAGISTSSTDPSGTVNLGTGEVVLALP
jgi:hypothetical protein